MFKLKKIMNKSNNSCEIEFYPSSDSVTVDYGQVLRLCNGMLTTPSMAEMENCPKYYTLGTAVADDVETKIPCVRITDDMIFEVSAMTEGMTDGTPVALYAESDYDGALHVGQVDDGTIGDGVVTDGGSYSTKGTVYVRLYSN